MKYLEQLNLGGAKISFGTEIEFKGPELFGFFNKYKQLPMEYIFCHNFESLSFDKWCLDIDNSVSRKIDCFKYGGELSSRIFWNDKSDWEELILFCDALKESGAYIDGDCSNHVSVGFDFLKDNKELLMLFFKVIAVFENEILHFAYGDMLMLRNDVYGYAKPVAPFIFENLNRLESLMKTFDFYDTLLTMKDGFLPKKNAINLDFNMSAYSKNRIEFRYPNGTLNPCVIQNNINFFLKIFLSIIDNKFDLDYLNYIIKRYQKEIEEDWYLSGYINSENIKKLCEAICLDSDDRDNFGEQFERVLKIEGITDIK